MTEGCHAEGRLDVADSLKTRASVNMDLIHPETAPTVWVSGKIAFALPHWMKRLGRVSEPLLAQDLSRPLGPDDDLTWSLNVG